MLHLLKNLAEIRNWRGINWRIDNRPLKQSSLSLSKIRSAFLDSHFRFSRESRGRIRSSLIRRVIDTRRTVNRIRIKAATVGTRERDFQSNYETGMSTSSWRIKLEYIFAMVHASGPLAIRLLTDLRTGPPRKGWVGRVPLTREALFRFTIHKESLSFGPRTRISFRLYRMILMRHINSH